MVKFKSHLDLNINEVKKLSYIAETELNEFSRRYGQNNSFVNPDEDHRIKARYESLISDLNKLINAYDKLDKEFERLKKVYKDL